MTELNFSFSTREKRHCLNLVNIDAYQDSHMDIAEYLLTIRHVLLHMKFNYWKAVTFKEALIAKHKCPVDGSLFVMRITNK